MSVAGVPDLAAQPRWPGPDWYHSTIASGTTSAAPASAARTAGSPGAWKSRAQTDSVTTPTQMKASAGSQFVRASLPVPSEWTSASGHDA